MSASASRIAAIGAIGGSVLLFIGTYLHPMEADPNQPVAAFAEYAADRIWVASHLTQLAGVALMVATLLLVARELESGAAAPWARLAAGGAVASLAVGAALQAVDGVALKTMVDAWAAAPAPQKDVAFHAAFAVRQVEVGLASVAELLMGTTIALSGVALLVDARAPRWLAWLAILGGVPTALSGLVTAQSGFSELSMAINMPASFLLLVWMFTLGVRLWRRDALGRVESAGARDARERSRGSS